MVSRQHLTVSEFLPVVHPNLHLHFEERIHIAITSSSMVINDSKIPYQNSHNEQKLVLMIKLIKKYQELQY
jgi:hypothetical protein